MRVLLSLCLLAGPAWAGSYPVTTTAEDDAVLQAEVDRLNERGAARDPLTVETYVQELVDQALRPLRASTAAAEAQQACQAYRALPPEKLAALLQELGGKRLCR